MFVEYLENPQAINSMYDDLDLDGVILKDLKLSREGPEVYFTIKLSKFPDRPPKKWDKEFNSANIEFKFVELENIKLLRWGRYNFCNGLIRKNQDGAITLEFKGLDVDLSVRGKFLTFVKISGYCNGRTET